MFFKKGNLELENSIIKCLALEAMVDSIERNIASISFSPEGNILSANSLFLDLMGYTDEEVIGGHHRMFCDKEYVDSPQYKDFWRQLGNKKKHSGIFARVNKKGETVWLEATYFPVLDKNGQLVKIYKIASDVSAQHKKQAI